jgi:HSP20 family molecular chaperone IbpA
MVITHARDLFNDPFFIGFNRELNRLNTAHKTNSQSYPPYDLLKLDEDTYQISLAIAGFSKEDIVKLQQWGYYIHVYESDDYWFYEKFQHFVIKQDTAILIEQIDVLSFAHEM